MGSPITDKLLQSHRDLVRVIAELYGTDDPHGALDRIFEHSEGAAAILAEYDAAAKDPPTVVVSIENGVTQSYFSDAPVRVVLIDYDTDGSDPDDLKAVPEFPHGAKTEQAWCSVYRADEQQPGWVRMVINAAALQGEQA